MAPELILHNQEPTPESDVYSFGMLIYEVMTGRQPYEEIQGMADLQILKAITEGKRPAPGVEISSDLRKLMVQCWSEEPESRPGIGQVTNEITRIIGQSDIVSICLFD